MGEISGLVDAVSGLSDRDVVAFTGETEALGRLVDALRVRAAGEIDVRSRMPEREPKRQVSTKLGCRNAVEALERIAGVSDQTAQQRTRLDRSTRPRATLAGEELPAPFPAVSAVFRSGALGEEAARYVTTQLSRVARRGVAARNEIATAEFELVAGVVDPDERPDLERLADEIPELEGHRPFDSERPTETYGQLKVMTDTWVRFLERDGFDPDAEVASRCRGLTLGREKRGLIPIFGSLVPETAAGLKRLFDAHAASRVAFQPTEDVRLAEEKTEEDQWVDADVVRDPRTPAQRRHDVLTSIVQTAAASADAPSLGGAAPTLVVTTTASDLDGGIARIDGIDIPVPASVANRIACTGAVQKMVFDDRGRLIRLGARERLFNAHQRRAITARDGGCVIPGCSIPAAWCEIHHVEEHSHGGPTHTDNGVLLCWWHHHYLEDSGWRIQMRRGVPHVAAPGWIDRHRRFRPACNRSRGTPRRNGKASASTYAGGQASGRPAERS